MFIYIKGVEEEIYNIFNKYGYSKVIIYWYSGDIKILDKFIVFGCYFIVSVDLGYFELSEEILFRILINRLFVEIDGLIVLEWVNGKYGYLSVIIDVIKKIVERKVFFIDELLKIIEDNFFNLIGLK